MIDVSLVVSTLGRSDVLEALLRSLTQQDFKKFEVIIVDQNADDRLLPIVEPSRWPYRVRHIRTPDQKGVSRGRNVGLKHAEGAVVLFPDDDCWYPPSFLSKGLRLLDTRRVAVVTGRATDETGRSINGRFEDHATLVDRDNVWTTQIEWMVLFRRDALMAVGGYDEKIGPPECWGANEGQDLLLRLLAAGFRIYYDPSLCGFHAELNTSRPDAAMMIKGRSYARGFGYVLKRHFGVASLVYWVSRPFGGVLVSLLRGNRLRSRYYANVVVGRLEGWLGRTIDLRL